MVQPAPTQARAATRAPAGLASEAPTVRWKPMSVTATPAKTEAAAT